MLRWLLVGCGLGLLVLIVWGLIWLELALREWDRVEEELD